MGWRAWTLWRASTHNAAFADLTPEVRDELLTSMDNGTAAGFPVASQFFARVRRLTLEGMFSDPYYGGNKNFAGWDLIRYPGPRLAVAPEDQKMSTPPKPYRRSAYGTGSMPQATIMAINLKPVDVAVIGLGAAGGVAVLPLARAGLKVAGIEAGTWMDPHSFKPDEIYNNVRALVTSVPKAKREIPTFRTSVRTNGRGRARRIR